MAATQGSVAERAKKMGDGGTSEDRSEESRKEQAAAEVMATLLPQLPGRLYAKMVQTRKQRKKRDDAAGITPPAAAKDDSDVDGNDSSIPANFQPPGDTPKNKRKRGESNGNAQRRTCESTSCTAPVSSPANPPSIITINDDVTKVKTAKKCAQRWKDLFMLRDNRKTLIDSPSAAESDHNDRDVFDCSDLIVPPAHDLVNYEVERGIKRWKDLASRVVIEEEGPNTFVGNTEGDSADGEEGVPLRNRELLLDAAVRGDKRKQRLMPHNFDYACRRNPTDGPINENDGDGPRHRPQVISLLDPTQTLSYEKELWRVFKSVKTTDELERLHALGSGAAIDGDDNEGIGHHGCQHTLGVKNDLKEWFSKYSRLDAHSLGRLRNRDRHSNPIGGCTLPCASTSPLDGNHMELGCSNGRECQSPGTLHTTIRFEILRHSQNLKRGSGTDGNRMEVELHGSQHTLLDLHRLLVECSLNTASHLEGSDHNNNVRAGVFFIENTFYTCGEVGYNVGRTIVRWLDRKDDGSEMMSETEERPSPPDESITTPRRQFLGLSSSENLMPMSQMKLEDIPLRLGVRYFHTFVPPPVPLHLRPNNLCSIANESAVFVTGIHTRHNTSMNNFRNEGIQSSNARVPIIIHDTWAPPQRHTCLACDYSPASVVAVNDPLTDSAPPSLDPESNQVHLQGVPMCSSCYQALHYQPSNRREEGENGSESLLELRQDHQPSLVFNIEDYQRMATASLLDKVRKSSAF